MTSDVKYKVDESTLHERNRLHYGGLLIKELELILNSHIDKVLYDRSLAQVFKRVRADSNSPYIVDNLNGKPHLFLK